MAQKTEFPWSGCILIYLLETPHKECNLKLRIPGWATRAVVRIKGRPEMPGDWQPSSYLTLHRLWQPGDSVELNLEMQTQWIEANPIVEETLGQVAIKRGPIVYCLESADLPSHLSPLQVRFSPGVRLLARYDHRLLGRVVVLEGMAEFKDSDDWTGCLYRPFRPRESRSIPIQLIPYYAWGNRGVGEVSVWLLCQ